MILTKTDIMFLGCIVAIGFGIGLHLDIIEKGDMYRIQNILSQAIVESQSGFVQSAFMADDANGLISHATIGFGLEAVLVDPDGPEENGEEYIDNQVTECRFHSDEDIDESVCIVCALVDKKLDPCVDTFLDFDDNELFPDGTTQDDINLGLAPLGITITGDANNGMPDDLQIWDPKMNHVSLFGNPDEDDDIEDNSIGGDCDDCDGFHMLIFPDDEDNNGIGDPGDDSAAGGTITMTFDTPIYFAGFKIVDIENDQDAEAIAYSNALSATACDQTSEIKTVPIPKVGNGDVSTINVDANNVSCIEIIYHDSGGVTEFDFRCIKEKLEDDAILAKALLDLPDGYEASTPLIFEYEDPADVFETMGVRVGIFKSVIDFDELSHGDEHDVIEDFLMDNYGIDLEVIDFDDDELESIMYDSENIDPLSADKDLEQPLTPSPNDLGNLLVIREDGSGSGNQPNDRGAGGIIRFKSVESNTYISMDHVDHEPGDPDDSQVRFHKSFDCSDANPAIVDIPATEAGGCSEDCHWNEVVFGEAGEDVQCMEIFYADSGGFTNFVMGCVEHGGQGCTPGYWKQSQHFDSWVGYTTDQTVGSVFDQASMPDPFDKTLLEALEFTGGEFGQEGKLLRAAVAAILSASNGGVDYPLGVPEITMQVNAAIASGDNDTMEDQKDLLDHLNNLFCPLNGD